METHVLDPSKLDTILLSTADVWANARAVAKTNLVAIAPTFKGICDISQVVVPDFFRGNDKRTPQLKMAWIEACTSNPQYKTGMAVRGIPCDFTGWTVGTQNQTVEITSYVEDAFHIPYKTYDNLFTVDQLFTAGYNRCMKGLIEKINDICIAKLASYAGVNAFQKVKQMGKNGSGAGANAWKITDIPETNLTQKGVQSYMANLQVMNKMVSPSLFVGGALETSENFVNDGNNRFNFGGLPVYSDMTNFPKQELEEDMFLVSNSAVAFLNTWNYETTPSKPMGPEEEVYVAASLPAEYSANGYPIMADITRRFWKREIAEGRFGALNVDNACEWVESYNIRISFEIPLNPLACQEGQTGVIRLHANDTLQPFLSPSQIQQTYLMGTR